MTIRDIFVNTDDNQRIAIINSFMGTVMWDGCSEDIPGKYFDRWIDRITCSGKTLIIWVDPD